MINFKGKEGIIFNFRAVAVIIDEDYVLLYKSEKDDFWSLPGGRVEFGEQTEETVVRELREEIDVEAKIIRQIWYVEDFYDYNGEKYHEIGVYYLTDIEDKMKDKEKEYIGCEGDKKLTYKWFKLINLEKIEIFPVFLKSRLNNTPKNIEKLVQI